MGMSRTNAVTYLHQQFSTLEDLLDVPPSDSPDGYSEVITDALLLLKKAYEDSTSPTYLVTDKISDYRLLLRYFALYKFKALLATDESYAVGGANINTKRSVAFSQVNVLLQDVVNSLLALSYPVTILPSGAGKAIKLHAFTVDVFEPTLKETKADAI